ncbi:hypothetical protein HY570_02545, partial [Candidatus Micrarchaeota archaeon]|nr:hypothetical protein [Candidatus Micrarchaeota archaeon]
DFVVFFIDEVNAEIGEQIVLLDLFAKKGCFISDLDLSNYIKNTSLANWPTLSQAEASRFILEQYSPTPKEGEPIVFIDHSFEVKGIGSVLLGLVHQGTVKVHDNLICYPSKKELEVKSIQKNDQDVNEAFYTDRLGLGIRKLRSEDIERGSVISKKELQVVKEVENKIAYSKFASKDSTALHAFHCLQAVPCTVKDNKILFERELALVPGLPIVFCDLNKKLRVIGIIKVA